MGCCFLLCRLLVSFPWNFAKLPGSRKRKNKTDPFCLSTSLYFLTSLKFPCHQQNWEQNEHGSLCRENPTLSCCWVLTNVEGLVWQWIVLSFICTLTSYIPFSKNQIPKYTLKLVSVSRWCKPCNRKSITYTVQCHANKKHNTKSILHYFEFWRIFLACFICNCCHVSAVVMLLLFVLSNFFNCFFWPAGLDKSFM